MMSPTIGRLHIISDTQLQQTWSHVELAQMAARGGADVVQFRHKAPAAPEFLRQVTTSMRQALPPAVQLVINDHVDVAQSIPGAGVHLGATDMQPRQARYLLGARACIGVTANSLDEARRLFAVPVDYLGVGPLFGTISKAPAAAPLGLEHLREIVDASPLPVIAIGGIAPQHVASIIACGAHGIAILSGAVCQPDVVAAVHAYRQALQAALPSAASTEVK
jgi:thiamine-phosphate pyrophosphorylase